MIQKGTVRYDAVFMDHMMPGMDGVEAVRIIREEIGTEYAKRVPIIVLTANVMRGNEEMFLGRGFQDFLSKPIDIFRLDAVIHRWVRDKTKEQEMKDAGPRETGGTGGRGMASWKIPGLDIAKALERFSQNEEALAGALESYGSRIHSQLDSLRDIPGPDQPEALKRYTITVHGVKGASYGVCADQAGRLAEELEAAARAGDLEYIAARNGELITQAEQLAAALSAKLEQGKRKPGMDEPDPRLLSALKDACRLYAMDEIDRIMEELERSEYHSGQDLVLWLRQRIDMMDFQAVSEKL
jgi:CheY-like chemotaxis protein